MRTEVDGSAGTAHLAADGALAELIRHGRAGLDRENHCPAMTASLELDWHGSLHGELMEGLRNRATGTDVTITPRYNAALACVHNTTMTICVASTALVPVVQRGVSSQSIAY